MIKYLSLLFLLIIEVILIKKIVYIILIKKMVCAGFNLFATSNERLMLCLGFLL